MNKIIHLGSRFSMIYYNWRLNPPTNEERLEAAMRSSVASRTPIFDSVKIVLNK